ncbi:MAG TPA: response regulator [Nitrospiraceae bacterium]|nr:response regulator [Nitrospiraceae bacterium]
MISLHSIPHSPAVYFMSGADRDDERDKPSGEHPGKGLKSLRVLIVEDEFFISLSTEAILASLGHVVVGVAVSANEAEQIAEDERPDVVLMDIRLIGARDGIDAATAIHDKLGIRSIFVTANTDARTKQRALAAHPLGFIEKPLTERRLRDELSGVN